MYPSISNNCVALVKRFEGCKLKSYKDIAGVWTIGYGSTGPTIGPATVWTQQQADYALLTRLNSFASQVYAAIGQKCNQNQFDALCSLCYNIGIAAFRGSTIVRLINQRDYKGAAEELLKWDHVKGIVVPGLLNRREAERELFLS